MRYDTRLALSLLRVNGWYPFLREMAVWGWALGRLQADINTFRGGDAVDGGRREGDVGDVDVDTMRNYAVGNAYSQNTEPTEDTITLLTAPNGEIDDGVLPAEWLRELCVGALSPSNDAALATRAVLNAVCHLAGRQTLEEPFYTFDGVRVMK